MLCYRHKVNDEEWTEGTIDSNNYELQELDGAPRGTYTITLESLGLANLELNEGDKLDISVKYKVEGS